MVPQIQDLCVFRTSSTDKIYQGLTNLKSQNKVYKDVSIAVKKCLSFPILFKFKEKPKVILKKNVPYGREMSENINGSRSETIYLN